VYWSPTLLTIHLHRGNRHYKIEDEEEKEEKEEGRHHNTAT